MDYAMEKKSHQITVPNVTLVYPWEADVISATKSWLVHEYEIKVSRSDFLADKNKKAKHKDLSDRFKTGAKYREPKTDWERSWFESGYTTKFWINTPNYFWYVTHGFEIETDEIPHYAGWMVVEWEQRKFGGNFRMRLKKNAPRIHTDKMPESTRLKLGRWLSFKLSNMYDMVYLS